MSCHGSRRRLFGGGSRVLPATLAAIAAGAAPAAALDDCGLPMGGVVICDAANEADSYQNADGIAYQTPDLTILHPGDGIPTEFIASGGLGAFGDLTVTSSGPVVQTATSMGLASAGILVATTDGRASIVTSSTGTVLTTTDGVHGLLALSQAAGAAGSVSIQAAGAVETQGQTANGIMATSTGGPVTVGSGTVATSGGFSGGIVATSGGLGPDGAVEVTAAGTVSTGGANSNGIAANGGGAISVTTQAVSTLGDASAGIAAVSLGAGADGQVTVRTEGLVSTAGQNAAGIAAVASDGDIELFLQQVQTGGNLSGGVTATALGAGRDIRVVAGTIATGGDSSTGMVLTGAGAIDLMLQTATTTGTAAAAVFAQSTGAGEAVTIALAGPLSTLGHDSGGIVALHNAVAPGSDVTIDVAGPISTAGNNAVGLQAGAAGGRIVVLAGAIATEGDASTALIAVNSGPTPDGTIEIRALGPIATTGQSAFGVVANGNRGAVTLEAVAVSATGLGSHGILASSQNAPLEVTLTDVAGGWGAGVGAIVGTIDLGGVSRTTLLAGGSLGALSDQAFRGIASSDEVALFGTMTGIVLTGPGDDRLLVHDGGRFDLRRLEDSDGDGLRDALGAATSDFGDGEDLLEIRPGGTLAFVTGLEGLGRLNGLEMLRNEGVITLVDADGGEAATAGERLLVEGSYLGQATEFGGRLRLDSQLMPGGLTDRLLISGDASGTTLVEIVNDGGLGGATGNGAADGLSLVQVGGPFAPAAGFVLEAPLVLGAFQYDIFAFDPASSAPGELDPALAALGVTDFWDFRLQSAIFPGVREYSVILQGASLLGQAALEAALHRPDGAPPLHRAGAQTASLGATDSLQQAVRPTADDGVATGAWVAAFGEGLSVSPSDGGDFGQANYGLQGGYDLFGWHGLLDADDRLTLGVAGTLAAATQDFSGSATELDLSLYGGAAYAAYRLGGFSAGLVLQGLGGEAEVSAPLSGIADTFPVATFGVAGEASWRLDLGAVFLQPAAELRYLKVWGGGLADGSGESIALEGADSLIARGEVRAGAAFDAFAPYASLGVAHEFLGSSSASLSGLTFESTIGGTALEVGGGLVAWAPASNLTLELGGRYRFGERVEGFAVSGGLKLSW